MQLYRTPGCAALALQVAGGAMLPSFGGCVELKDVVFRWGERQ